MKRYFWLLIILFSVGSLTAFVGYSGDTLMRHIESLPADNWQMPELESVNSEFLNTLQRDYNYLPSGHVLYRECKGRLRAPGMHPLQSESEAPHCEPLTPRFLFFPQSYLGKDSLHGILHGFNYKNNSVMLAGIAWDPRWKYAIQLHELWHLHNLTLRGGRPNSTEELELLEELTAREIQRMALQVATDMEYGKRLIEFAKTYHGVPPGKLAEAITVEDFNHVNSLFKASGTLEARERAMQYTLDIGMYSHSNDRQRPPKGWGRTERLTFYKSVINHWK
ncbi:MAG TPA: hypothetical protein VEA59_02965 [Patescibacteria group bacterium]|nr:hypothetical protein [Patescibacteria group bacterium]